MGATTTSVDYIRRDCGDVNLNERGSSPCFFPSTPRNSSYPNNYVMFQEKSPCSCSLGNFMDFRTFSLMFLSRFIIRARKKLANAGTCKNLEKYFRGNYELLIMARVFSEIETPLHPFCLPCPMCKRIWA